ncbi:uncharacterized protein LOC134699004 isoform X2 [Mytilus trossulus]|uniref:uncharacterized protein LOC134699004 isoform X2 n=1 Tax=Mytilus trossulus TaxID=6551 RepID=UPI0030066149
METQRNSDVRATERVFKKVVYPGLETLRVVDRNGIPLNYPAYNSVHSKSFVLSPRGVPMRKSNHVYSGSHSHPAKLTDLVDNTSSPDNYYGPEKTFLTQGSYSAKLPRNRNESPLQHKQRANTSQSMAPKHTSKSISSDHYLTGEPNERRILQAANNNYFNLSNQGLRLQREWTSLSNTRSMRRASEIVNHRVDRMYFMNGNSIKLKPKYDVDEEELNRMKEEAHKRDSRTSSRNSMKSGPKKKDPIDLKKTIGTESEGGTGDVTTSSEVNLKKPNGRLSPINGWEGKEKVVEEENDLLRQNTLHEGNDGEKTEEIVVNGDTSENKEEESDGLQGMRADGRIDSSALNNDTEKDEEVKENDVTVNGKEETTQEADEQQGETIDENVAQENT